MVTHTINVLPHCDLVVVMKDGKFQEIGSYRLLMKSGGPFAEFLEHYFQQMSEEEFEGNIVNGCR